jgi:DNA repair protein RadC
MDFGSLTAYEYRTLDTKSDLPLVAQIYAGSLNTVVGRMSAVLRDRIRANRASMIVLCNHPSGNRTPSPDVL